MDNDITNAITAVALNAAESLAYIAIAIIVLFVATKLFDLTTKCDDNDEIEAKANTAIAIRRAGLYIGLTLGMIGALSGDAPTFLEHVGMFALDGAIVVVMMLVASVITNKLLLPGLNCGEELGKSNRAVGCVEFGTYVAVGLMAYASFSSEDDNWAAGIVFFALGLLGLILVYHLFRVKPFAKFDMSAEIAASNASAGAYVASRLVALGIILAASLSGPFESWSQDVTAFVLYSVFGIILLAVVSWVSDLIFLPKSRIRDQIVTNQNVASMLLVGGVQVSVAVIVASIL